MRERERESIKRSILSISTKHNANIDEIYHQLTVFNILDSASFFYYFQMIEEVEGDIVECGIGRSRSLGIISALVQWLCPDRHIHAYDSFAGFPEPTSEDKSLRNPQKGEWACSPSGKYDYTEEFSKKVLDEIGIDLGKIHLSFHKGFFVTHCHIILQSKLLY